MLIMPDVVIATADTREIRPDTPRAPLERAVEDRIIRRRHRAIARRLPDKGADHLRVTGIATLLDVDVPALELERRIGRIRRGRHGLGRGDDGREDLHDAADQDSDEGEHRERRRLPLKLRMEGGLPVLARDEEDEEADEEDEATCDDDDEALDGLEEEASRDEPDADDRRPDLRGEEETPARAALFRFLRLVREDGHLDLTVGRLTGARRGDQVPRKEHEAEEVERAADEAHPIHREDGDERLDEGGVKESAALMLSAPHQALGDASGPERADIEQDTERPDPEMEVRHRARFEGHAIEARDEPI